MAPPSLRSTALLSSKGTPVSGNDLYLCVCQHAGSSEKVSGKHGQAVSGCVCSDTQCSQGQDRLAALHLPLTRLPQHAGSLHRQPACSHSHALLQHCEPVYTQSQPHHCVSPVAVSPCFATVSCWCTCHHHYRWLCTPWGTSGSVESLFEACHSRLPLQRLVPLVTRSSLRVTVQVHPRQPESRRWCCDSRQWSSVHELQQRTEQSI